MKLVSKSAQFFRDNFVSFFSAVILMGIIPLKFRNLYSRTNSWTEGLLPEIFDATITLIESVGVTLIMVLILSLVKIKSLRYVLAFVFTIAYQTWWTQLLIQFRLLGRIVPFEFQLAKTFGETAHSVLLPGWQALSINEVVLISFIVILSTLSLRRAAERKNSVTAIALMSSFVVASQILVVSADIWRRYTSGTFQMESYKLFPTSVFAQIGPALRMRIIPFPYLALVQHLVNSDNMACYPFPKTVQQRHVENEQVMNDPEVNSGGNEVNFINFQMESINTLTLNLKRENGEYVLPFLRKILLESEANIEDFPFLFAGATDSAEFSVLCGIEPSLTRNEFFRMSTFRAKCLPQRLQDLGFATITAHANTLDFYNRGEAYVKLGFSDLYSIKDMLGLPLSWSGLGPSDAGLFTFAGNILDVTQSPKIFLHLVGLESHAPFFSKPEQLSVNKIDLLCPTCQQVRGFAETATAVDQAIFNFTNLLKYRSNSQKKTIVLTIYGDHPPPLNRDMFSDAKFFATSVNYIEFRTSKVPFVSLLFQNGQYKVLPFPKSGIYSHADVMMILADQLDGLSEEEKAPLAELRQVLNPYHESRKRLPKDIRISSGKVMTADGNIRELSNEPPESPVWDEVYRTEKAFSCLN